MPRSRFLTRPLSMLLLLGGSAAPLSAQCPSIDELTPADAGFDYGAAVSVSGDRAAVGDRFDEIAGVSRGSVTIWEHDGLAWVQGPLLSASDGLGNDQFGDGLELSGDVLAVGASGVDDDGGQSGAVYVFRHDGVQWVEEAKLSSPTGLANLRYGFRLALDGDVLAVGHEQFLELWRHTAGTGWSFEQTLSSPAALYGQSFDLSGDRLLVGSILEPGGGAADLYEYDGSSWQLVTTLRGSQTTTGRRFGQRVQIDGEVVVISDTSEPPSGALYVFEFDGSTWVEVALLQPSIPVRSFGNDLELDGHSALSSGILFDGIFEFRRTKGVWHEALYYLEDPLILGIDYDLDGSRALVSSNARALEFPVSTLRLRATPPAPAAGDTLELLVTPGPPGAPVLLYSMAVNGAPLKTQLLGGAFDAQLRLERTLTVPAGLAGIELRLQAFGLGAAGEVLGSNLVDLDFQ